MYLLNPHNPRQIIGVCNKAGSTSARNYFRIPNLKPLTDILVSEARICNFEIFGLLRDPLDRIESCYNFFKHNQGGVFPNCAQYKNFEHFLDSVLKGAPDSHWSPQCGQIMLCEKFYDLETYPLQVRKNVAEHIEKIPPSYIRDLKIYYAADYAKRGNKWQ